MTTELQDITEARQEVSEDEEDDVKAIVYREIAFFFFLSQSQSPATSSAGLYPPIGYISCLCSVSISQREPLLQQVCLTSLKGACTLVNRLQ